LAEKLLNPHHPVPDFVTLATAPPAPSAMTFDKLPKEAKLVDEPASVSVAEAEKTGLAAIF